MVNQLILATVMVVVIVVIHLSSLAILTRLLRSHSRVMRSVRIMPITLLAGATMGIIAIYTFEIWLYPAAYLGLGAFRILRTRYISRLRLTRPSATATFSCRINGASLE